MHQIPEDRALYLKKRCPKILMQRCSSLFKVVDVLRHHALPLIL